MKQLKKFYNSLIRDTAGKQYLAFVDGIRFMAIMPVVLLHANERLLRYVVPENLLSSFEHEFSYVLSRGAIGVMIFFTLSGFILSLPFAKGAELKYRSYITRRLTRIEPPYIFWMSFFALILWAKSGMGLGELLPHYVSSIFYVHTIAYQDFSIINPVAWSLEVEIQFYLVAPFIAQLYFSLKDTKSRRSLLAFFTVLFIIYQHLLGWQLQPYRATILGQLQHFMVGLFMADVFIHSKEWVKKKGLIWDLVTLVSVPVMMFTWTDEMAKSLLFVIAMGGFFLGALKGKFFPQLLSLKPLAIIGGMCYTIYLTHLPLLELLYSFIGKFGQSSGYFGWLSISLIIALPLILLSSAVFYKVIEKPFMRKDGFKLFIQSIKERFTKTSRQTTH